MRSSVRGGLRAFSASAYVTSSSMSVDASPKTLSVSEKHQWDWMLFPCFQGLLLDSTPLCIQDQSLHSWCTHWTLLMRGEKKNTWLKFPHNSFSNSALLSSFCVLLISGSICFALLHWHFFPRMITKVG